MIPYPIVKLLGSRLFWEAVALAGLLAFSSIQTHRLKGAQASLASEKATHAAFVEQVRQQGETAKVEAAKKEKDNAKRYQLAVGQRDDARKQLRDFKSSAGQRYVPQDTGPAACYDPERLDAALRGFATAVEGLVREGAGAADDLTMTIQAWPR